MRRPELILSTQDKASHKASLRTRRRSRRAGSVLTTRRTGASGTKVLTGDDQGQLCADRGAATVGGVEMPTLRMEVRDEE